MKKAFATLLATVMLISALGVGTTVSADNNKRPEGFVPWYSYENLNVGVDSTMNEPDAENTCLIGGIEVIQADSMDVKIGVLQDKIIAGGPGGKLLTYGAGPKMKIDNKKHTNSSWWQVNVSTSGDPQYSQKKFTDCEWICFYVDMTHWSIPEREAQYEEAKGLDIILLFQAIFSLEDQEYPGYYCLISDKPYQIQDENGNWVEHTSKGEEPKDRQIKIPEQDDPITIPIQNTYIPLSRGYKGYVRFRVSDTYPCTYYDLTRPWCTLGKDGFIEPCGFSINADLKPGAVGVSDDMTEPGYMAIGDFGFMPKDPEPVVADESKAEESKAEESKAEDSKAEESEEEPSKIEASKTEESVIPAQNNTENKSSHKGLWIALGVILVVLIGGGVAAFIVIKKKKSSPLNDEDLDNTVLSNEDSNDSNSSEESDDLNK